MCVYVLVNFYSLIPIYVNLIHACMYGRIKLFLSSFYPPNESPMYIVVHTLNLGRTKNCKSWRSLMFVEFNYPRKIWVSIMLQS